MSKSKKDEESFLVIRIKGGCVVDVQSNQAGLRVILIDEDTNGDSSQVVEVDGEAAEINELVVEPMILDPAALLGG